MMRVRGEAWIQTYTGRKFWPLVPEPEDICIEDIAHALSLQCRFGGHVRTFYSVAQHSVHVSETCDRADALWGLLHDATEAYLTDVCRPVKQQSVMRAYREAEAVLMAAICRRFGLSPEEPASVKRADDVLLTTEARDLMAPLAEGWRHTPANGYVALPDAIRPWEARNAARLFLFRYHELQTIRCAS